LSECFKPGDYLKKKKFGFLITVTVIIEL